MKLPPTLAALTLCAPIFHMPIARAQAATPPASSVPLAQIDPAALNLLARMSWKYKHVAAYETYIDVKHSEPPDDAPVVRRLRTDRGAFVWSELTPDKQWRKWIYGVPWTSIAYDSRFPKRYVRRELNYSGEGDTQRAVTVLKLWGIDDFMLLPVLSGEWPAQLMVHPALESLALTTENGLDVVTLSLNGSFLDLGLNYFVGVGNATFRFHIEPQTLLLRRIERSETRGNKDNHKTETITENYPNARFEPSLDHEIFSSAAPLNYKRVGNFEEPVAKP